MRAQQLDENAADAHAAGALDRHDIAGFEKMQQRRHSFLGDRHNPPRFLWKASSSAAMASPIKDAIDLGCGDQVGELTVQTLGCVAEADVLRRAPATRRGARPPAR